MFTSTFKTFNSEQWSENVHVILNICMVSNDEYSTNLILKKNLIKKRDASGSITFRSTPIATSCTFPTGSEKQVFFGALSVGKTRETAIEIHP